MPYAEFCHKLCTLPLSQCFSPMSCLKMPQGQAHEPSLSLGGIPQRWCKWALNPAPLMSLTRWDSWTKHPRIPPARKAFGTLYGWILMSGCFGNQSPSAELRVGLCPGDLTGGGGGNEGMMSRHTEHPQKSCDQTHRHTLRKKKKTVIRWTRPAMLQKPGTSAFLSCTAHE